MKRKIKLNFYLAKKEISRIRDTINKDNTVDYLIENKSNLEIYNKYLNNIDIKYNELTREDIREEVDNLFFSYYSIYIL